MKPPNFEQKKPAYEHFVADILEVANSSDELAEMKAHLEALLTQSDGDPWDAFRSIHKRVISPFIYQLSSKSETAYTEAEKRIVAIWENIQKEKAKNPSDTTYN